VPRPLPSPLQAATRRAVLRCLRATEPYVSAGEAETAAEVEQHYRWNLAMNLLDGGLFWFGLSFLSAATIMPLFVRKLTDSTLAVGLVAVVSSGAWFLPQLFAAHWIERLPRMLPVVIRAGFFLERLPIWLFVPVALLAGSWPAAALLSFFFVYLWRGLGGGLVGPAWQDLIARCFPVNRRGRFLGTASFIGAGAAVAGAALSAWLLERVPFPQNFATIFAIAAVAITVAWVFLSRTREPAQPPSRRPVQRERFLARLPRVLRSDRNFRRFLSARWLVALGGMGSGFLTVAAVDHWQVSDATVGLFTTALWLGEMLGYLCFGLLADRFGNKLSLELGTAALVTAFVLAWLAPGPGWFYAVFALLGIHLSALLSSGILVTLEFSAAEQRPTYVGIANTSIGLVNVAAPLAGTWLATVGYGPLFAASAAASLAALAALHWAVREPRWSVAAGQ
jgi:MFS family permease